MQGAHAAHGVGENVLLHVALVMAEEDGRAAEVVHGLCVGGGWWMDGWMSVCDMYI